MSARLLAELARVLRAAADEADRIAAEDHAERRDWIPQGESELGPRRHISAVKRRVNAGLPGAAIVGRSFKLSKEAHAEELVSAGKTPAPKPSITNDLKAALHLVGGGR